MLTKLTGIFVNIFLVRHGTTEMNRKGLLQGRGGYGLLPEGREEARRAAAALRGKGVSLVFSSDQLRARQTASILRRELGIRRRVRLSRALREIDFGRVTGWPERKVEERHPEFKTDSSFVFPGGESYDRMQIRALGWIHRIAQRPPARTIAAVSHGGWVRTVLVALLGRRLSGSLRGKIPHGLVARVDVARSGALSLRLLAPVSFEGGPISG
jgi:broad specificity phosphatase PhoE